MAINQAGSTVSEISKIIQDQMADRVSSLTLEDGTVRIFYDGQSLGEFDPRIKYRFDTEKNRWIQIPPEPTLPARSRR